MIEIEAVATAEIAGRRINGLRIGVSRLQRKVTGYLAVYLSLQGIVV